MMRRIHVLQAATKTGYQSRHGGKSDNSIQTYHRGTVDRLELALKPDGTMDLSIETQSPRGVCGVSLSGTRPAPGIFVFHDKEFNCTVTLAVTDKSTNVRSSGNCSVYCGVHADFVGTYERDKMGVHNNAKARAFHD